MFKDVMSVAMYKYGLDCSNDNRYISSEQSTKCKVDELVRITLILPETLSKNASKKVEKLQKLAFCKKLNRDFEYVEYFTDALKR